MNSTTVYYSLIWGTIIGFEMEFAVVFNYYAFITINKQRRYRMYEKQVLCDQDMTQFQQQRID